MFSHGRVWIAACRGGPYCAQCRTAHTPYPSVRDGDRAFWELSGWDGHSRAPFAHSCGIGMLLEDGVRAIFRRCACTDGEPRLFRPGRPPDVRSRAESVFIGLKRRQSARRRSIRPARRQCRRRFTPQSNSILIRQSRTLTAEERRKRSDVERAPALMTVLAPQRADPTGSSEVCSRRAANVVCPAADLPLIVRFSIAAGSIPSICISPSTCTRSSSSRAQWQPLQVHALTAGGRVGVGVMVVWIPIYATLIPPRVRRRHRSNTQRDRDRRDLPLPRSLGSPDGLLGVAVR